MFDEDEDESAEHERLPEPWVQGWIEHWEDFYGPDELARLRSEPPDPIDRYLWQLWSELRRLCGAVMLRMDSNWPLDDEVLGEHGRDAVRLAVQHLADARRLINDVVGNERLLVFEQEQIDGFHDAANDAEDDDEDDDEEPF